MKLFITYCILFSLFTHSQAQEALIKGNIINYANQPLYIHQCYGDTLHLVDSIHTDKKGHFFFSPSQRSGGLAKAGLYKIILPRNQFFYIISPLLSNLKGTGTEVEIQTIYQPDVFYNIVSDSLKVLKSEENKLFYEFQRLQMPINVANAWLLQMMRLYPLPDPFHKQIEDEYFKRYGAMEQFVKKNPSRDILIAMAYYQPVNPDWKQPDPWRDSIIAAHYFDYFKPADPFYIHTNVLPEKMDLYIALKTNKRDNYGQPIHDEMLVKNAMLEFLENTKSNRENLDFCLNYLLKKLNKEKQFTALLEIYDKYAKPQKGDCESANKQLDWVRKKINVLRNIQIGSIAPDFEIRENIRLHQLQANYTLLVFWATWCPHCTKTLPEIKQVYNNFKVKGLEVVSVSLDSDKEEWQKCIRQNDLPDWFNTSELKGWNGEVPRQYNIYATPTMFLLDKDKKIIAKPETVEHLIQALQ